MKRKILLTLGTILFVLTNANTQLSTFDSDAQGWTVDGNGFNLTHFDSLGNPGGYIEASGTNGWSWNAPSIYLGNKISCLGGYISFDFKTTIINGPVPVSCVNFYGHGIRIFHPLSPSTTWTNYTFLLDSGGWTRDSAFILAPATSADFQLVFDSISLFQILGGYSFSSNTGSLDNVNLCATVGIEESKFMDSSIKIYPNPFATQTTFQTNKVLKDATLTLYNSLGQQVRQVSNIYGQTTTIYRDTLPEGLYYLQLTQGMKTIATDKIVITDY